MNPIVFGAIFGLGILGGVSIEKFEKDVAKDLGHYMSGPNKSIVVRAKVSLMTLHGTIPRVVVVAKDFSCESLPFRVEKWRSQYGRVKHLRVEMENFTLKGIRVESLKTDIPDVHFDLAFALSKHHFRVSRSGTGPLTVDLKLVDIQHFAAKKFPQLSDLEISSEGNRIVATGNASFAGLSLPFRISGIPKVEDQSKLALESPIILVNGKPVDPEKALGLFKGFSSLLDLNRDLGGGGGVRLDHFTLSDQDLIAFGTAQVSKEDTDSPDSGSKPKSKIVPK